MSNSPTCKWTEDFECNFETSCETSWIVDARPIKDCDYFYCPKCGKPIEETAYKDDERWGDE